jgi:hypothetical protein
MFHMCQRFTTNQYNVKRKGSKQRSKETEVLPGLAHRTVWCTTEQCPVHHRTVSGASGTVHFKLFTFGFLGRNSAIIHRTVRCASGVTATCAQRSTLQSEQCNSDIRAEGQRGTRLFGVAPDCPVPHGDKASNGRPAPSPNGRMTWRLTGHCPVVHRTLSGGVPDRLVRPSPAAFSNGYNLVGGYKYHPNRPLQGEGAQATFQVI